MTPVILRHDNPSETGGFQAGPPLRGPDGSAALIMLGGGAATGRFSLRRILPTAASNWPRGGASLIRGHTNGHASERGGFRGGPAGRRGPRGRRAGRHRPVRVARDRADPARGRDAGRPGGGRGRGPGGVLRPVPPLGPASRPRQGAELRPRRHAQRVPLRAAAADPGPAARRPGPGPGGRRLGGAGRAPRRGAPAGAERAAAAARPAAGGLSAPLLPRPDRAGDRGVHGHQPRHGQIHHVPRAGRAGPGLSRRRANDQPSDEHRRAAPRRDPGRRGHGGPRQRPAAAAPRRPGRQARCAVAACAGAAG